MPRSRVDLPVCTFWFFGKRCMACMVSFISDILNWPAVYWHWRTLKGRWIEAICRKEKRRKYKGLIYWFVLFDFLASNAWLAWLVLYPIYWIDQQSIGFEGLWKGFELKQFWVPVKAFNVQLLRKVEAFTIRMIESVVI